MAPNNPIELRLEVYSDGILDAAVAQKVTALLGNRWPVTWDVKVPPKASVDHPARWHAVVILSGEDTPESVHRSLVSDLRGIDPASTFHFRTRWDFPQSPNEQEIYEERWTPGRK